MKNKETLEEAAENYGNSIGNKNGTAQFDFIRGAKWQQEQFKNESTANYIDRHIVEALVETVNQERRYSEEDLEEAFKSGFTNCYNNNNLTFGEWLEQFKKK